MTSATTMTRQAARRGPAGVFSIEEIMEVTGARLLMGRPDALRATVRRLMTDSRLLKPGDLFIAFKGERFDGHQFVPHAVRQGVGAVLVTNGYRPSEDVKGAKRDGGPVFVLAVPDTVIAYQQLATHHRLRFTIPLVAVTGSNGKTTTKEMVARVLEERWRVLVTEGNFNNRIGVPQTLLRLTARHQAAVIEMGVDQRGQTARLADTARPTIGLITNIGPDHLEFFGSMDASAEAKGELLEWLGAGTVAVLNADDPYYRYLASRARCRVVSFGVSPSAQVRASDVSTVATGTTFALHLPDRVRATTVHLPVLGVHNVSNALAAAAVGYVCEISGARIAHGLARFKPAAMRSEVEQFDGIRIVVDCYNANPASAKAALDLLHAQAAGGRRTIAVLGDMLELGHETAAWHEDVGRHAAAQGIACLVTCGALGRGFATGARAAGMASAAITETRDAQEAAAALLRLVQNGDVVLVKGSRGMRMEQVVEALRHRFAKKGRGRSVALRQ